jgi:hypothetical protein
VEAGVQSEVRAQLRDLHPREPVTSLQGDQRDNAEEHDGDSRQPEKAGKRPPYVEGTHRISDRRGAQLRRPFPGPWSSQAQQRAS